MRRYGAEAPYAAALPDGPGAARGVTAQELHWGVAVEGALSIDDLLDRRTRLGLVAADREQSTDAAAAAFERAGVEPVADSSGRPAAARTRERRGPRPEIRTRPAASGSRARESAPSS